VEIEVKVIKCPNCGAALAARDKSCGYCGSPVYITTFSDVLSMPLPKLNKYVGEYKKALESDPDSASVNESIAFCYLKLGFYDKALASFEKAIEENFGSPDLYFYAAVCCFGGKNPFLHKREVVDRAEQFLSAALSIERRPAYLYLMYYIRHNYFTRKFLNASPPARQFLDESIAAGITESDVEQIKKLLGDV
jgi:tetratricopeptide (TPR) repeat protein